MRTKYVPKSQSLAEASLSAVDKFFQVGVTFGPIEIIDIKTGLADKIWKERGAELKAAGLTIRDLKALQADLNKSLTVVNDHASNTIFFTLPRGQKITFVTPSFKLTKLFSHLR